VMTLGSRGVCDSEHDAELSNAKVKM